MREGERRREKAREGQGTRQPSHTFKQIIIHVAPLLGPLRKGFKDRTNRAARRAPPGGAMRPARPVIKRQVGPSLESCPAQRRAARAAAARMLCEGIKNRAAADDVELVGEGGGGVAAVMLALELLGDALELLGDGGREAAAGGAQVAARVCGAQRPCAAATRAAATAADDDDAAARAARARLVQGGEDR